MWLLSSHYRSLEFPPSRPDQIGRCFIKLLESTHENDHLLDLVISRPTDFVLNVSVGEFFYDRRLVMFGIKARKSNEHKKMMLFSL